MQQLSLSDRSGPCRLDPVLIVRSNHITAVEMPLHHADRLSVCHSVKDCQEHMSRLTQAVHVQVHEARQFTDTSNFTLRCKDCQIGVKGEKEAIAHAKATGHANFGEY